MTGDPWRRFGEARTPARNLQFDSAAAGRCSVATCQAMARHLEQEASLGAYVAAADAEPVIETARRQLGQLIGVPPGGVAFVDSGSSARQAALAAWPLRRGDVVAVVASEWGPNLAAFSAAGLEVVRIDVCDGGAIDLGGLRQLLDSHPPALVHLDLVASHRPLVQPAREVAEVCGEAGVAVWLDAAQGLGHVDTAVGADLVYSTSRKWLNGPRGVGILAVAEQWWEHLDIDASPLARSGQSVGSSPVRLLDVDESNVAGRVGLAVALAELFELGPAAVSERLAAIGAMSRAALDDLSGWEVVEAVGPDCAITALSPTDGRDVAEVRTRLLVEHSIVTTAQTPVRAPLEMTGPTLRISPHVDCTPADLQRLHDALEALET